MHKTYRTFRRAVRLKKQKEILVTTFLLGELICRHNISITQIREYGMTKHNRRVALRLYYLYEHIGVQQLYHATKTTLKKVLNLKQSEYDKILNDVFAGTQA